jgi:hypothetical protein
VNGEFYADTVPLFLNRMDKRTVIFDVELYISWGTPQNLYFYEELAHLCEYGGDPPAWVEGHTDKLPLWEEYFDD